jgi:hypothetical protein
MTAASQKTAKVCLKTKLIFCLGCMLTLSACGGGGGDTPTPAPAPPSSPPSTCTIGVSVPVKTASLVTVSGQNASGIDIDVGGPQGCPTPNAEALGVADVSASSISATNVGVQVHRGDTKIMILFGPGMAAVTSAMVAGQPNDVVIGAITHPTAQDGTQGVQFTITVSPSAALGARTVVLRAANDDMSAFTGGLEVLP